MNDFWQSGTGKKINGTADEAFLGDFRLIPDGTVADAVIKKFVIVEKTNDYTGVTDKYFEITWKLVSGDFKSREVSQKIKTFSGKPEAIDRNLNMLMLVMKLCDFKLTHSNVPVNEELAAMVNKTLTIKIREWHMPKTDGSMMEGNHVSEVHPLEAIPTETGTLLPVHEKASVSKADSALSRNPRVNEAELNDDIPF